MSGPFRIRPAHQSDFDALMQIAIESGPGFTSLPVDEAILRERLVKSEEAFNGSLGNPAYGKYLLMLENFETGEIGGCSAVKAGTGVDAPFFNYRIITVSHTSREADRHFNLDALILTNEFLGYTEVGTLFLREPFRGSGAGILASQARYLLMTTSPESFGDMVLSELRGVINEAGETPFWEGLGRYFFRMSFAEADLLSATTDNQFILDLMPKYPIYIDLLPPEAREVIGRCHVDGVPAMKLLEREGFRFDRMVDIFDGGPIMVAPRNMIRTVRGSRRVKLIAGEDGEHAGLVSTTELKTFKASLLSGTPYGEDQFAVSEEIFEQLELKPGDEAMIWLRSDTE